MVYGLNHKPINPWFQFFFWPKSVPSLTLPNFKRAIHRLHCEKVQYDPKDFAES